MRWWNRFLCAIEGHPIHYGRVGIVLLWGWCPRCERQFLGHRDMFPKGQSSRKSSRRNSTCFVWLPWDEDCEKQFGAEADVLWEKM